MSAWQARFIKYPPFYSTEKVIEAADSNPECFKCQEPITELSEVRIVTVRIDGKPVNVWVHAEHANPDAQRHAH